MGPLQCKIWFCTGPNYKLNSCSTHPLRLTRVPCLRHCRASAPRPYSVSSTAVKMPEEVLQEEQQELEEEEEQAEVQVEEQQVEQEEQEDPEDYGAGGYRKVTVGEVLKNRCSPTSSPLPHLPSSPPGTWWRGSWAGAPCPQCGGAGIRPPARR